MQLEAVDSYLDAGNVRQAQETVQHGMETARTTLREARRAIQALRPAALAESTLVDVLGDEVDEFARRTAIRAAFQVGAAPPDLHPGIAHDILRIVQESLTNVARHAGAASVLVQLETLGDRLRVTVQDDGVGFDPEQTPEQRGSYGLRGMEERAAHLGGNLVIHSAPGDGTTITLDMEIPNDPRADR
jgi:signal transduction histidine kinase